MRIFTIEAAHYHPDDGAHDPQHDIKRYLIVAEDWKSAEAALRPYLGTA